MRAAIIIPARYGSSRFPGKPLAPIAGASGIARPLIARTIEAAQCIGITCDIRVATDDPRIAAAAQEAGADAVMTPATCRNGTERCQAAIEAAGIDADIVVNLQGDAPLTPAGAIEALIAAVAGDAAVMVATPMIRSSSATLERLRNDEASGRVGGTTVVTDGMGDALYFSKRILPCGGGTVETPVHLHIGLYAFRKLALAHYAQQLPSALERAEGLEQLRFLDARIPIRMVEVEEPEGGLWEVNNPGDIAIVERALALRGIE
ncbi:3-deoxy-manno-octulosonate cytidylyltransferase [Sphingomonas sp. DT-207]|uniref:3-deoxy-manno-octulosonate cytidylyltransferase n=1 Tax=Sphingomonas sp. DT-207 TaxID=3396167 RepID=UPI003F1E0353